MIKRENHADKKKGLRSQTRNLCVLPAFACFDTSCNRCCRGEERDSTRGDNATTRQGNKTNKRYKTTIQTNATACMFRVCIMFATPFSVCFETRHGSKLFDVSSGLVATICRHILGVLRVFRPRCTIPVVVPVAAPSDPRFPSHQPKSSLQLSSGCKRNHLCTSIRLQLRCRVTTLRRVTRHDTTRGAAAA